MWLRLQGTGNLLNISEYKLRPRCVAFNLYCKTSWVATLQLQSSLLMKQDQIKMKGIKHELKRQSFGLIRITSLASTEGLMCKPWKSRSLSPRQLNKKKTPLCCYVLLAFSLIAFVAITDSTTQEIPLVLHLL